MVQEIFLTETAFHADVVLPASAWPEKDGTVTNSNRQVQMGRAALEPPAGVRQDWWIVQEIARRMGLDWNYTGPADVFAEMKRVMPSLDHITWERVERESSVTYPCAAPDQPGAEVVFGEGFPTDSGRGRLVPVDIIPPDEQPDEAFPMILSTGRQLEHWHTGAITRRASVLDELEPEAVANLSPGELRRLGVSPGEFVRVSTRRGVIEIRSRADSAVPRRMRLHSLLFRRGGGQPVDQPGAGSLRQDSRVQVLRGEGGAAVADAGSVMQQRGDGEADGDGQSYDEPDFQVKPPFTKKSNRKS